MVQFDQNGPNAATIVREYQAGCCTLGPFQDFLQGQQEWLQCYNHDTLKTNYQKIIKHYKKWRTGGKSLAIPCNPFQYRLKYSFSHYFLEVQDYPPQFPTLAGLNLPANNKDWQGGHDINPGSDNNIGNNNNQEDNDDDKDEDNTDYIDENPEGLLDHLQQLAIQNEAPAQGGTNSNKVNDTGQQEQWSRCSQASTSFEIFQGTFMRIVKFLQPGRTIGCTREESRTCNMMTVTITLPPGVQVNLFKELIHDSESLKFA